MAGSPRNSLGNVRSDMDIAYPEHLSRLHRHSLLAEFPKSYYRKEKNTRNRRGIRYRTQPVTFGEIQEVDEESMIIESSASEDQGQSMSAASKLDLDFYRFAKALGPKRKKPNPTDVDMLPFSEKGVIDQNNGDEAVQALHARPVEQLRWTDYTREGSV